MNKIFYHVLGVLIYSLNVFIIDIIIDSDVKVVFYFLVLVRQIWVFYTVYFVLYFIFLSTPPKMVRAAALVIISLLVTYAITLLYAYLKAPDKPVDWWARKNFITLLSFYTHFWLYSVGYFFFERSLQNQRKAAQHEKNRILTEKKNLEKENEILLLKEEKAHLNQQLFQSETNFLRAQINPHFLQNCLNFLYSDTRKTNPDAAEAILLLSELMRYSVSDNSATGGMTMLEDEVNQVDSIIKIHQLRFQESLNIVFIKEGNLTGKRIVPMILLTLVENLIKYGDLKDSHNPAHIKCSVDETNKKIIFKTINKKAFLVAASSTGLGHKNINERLMLVWKDNFSFAHDDANGFYTVHLVMPFTDV